MTDEELMRAVCDGDQSAYQTIVKQHLNSISHFAFGIIGNQNDTEDISQETFLKLWIKAEKWQPEKAKLSTWLHRITHNLCVDYLRKHGNTEAQEHVDVEKEVQADWQDGYGVSEDREKQGKLLRKVINNLPENQRSALVLCHYSGFSNKEAAVILDVSVKALESTIARAKRTLRKQLSGALRAPSEETSASSDVVNH
ncbi:MAG: sigma-70 family RNA polymerase sigma factor [Gammaproteobacteria bacterium]|nr:sigma-70 family RNA polymerase sigma factor [Gammaproteobacteria bacterium]MDD9957591.1 sigma-70 family RNA polymerase sigma factor [Gammaproteobacteria bacterium]